MQEAVEEDQAMQEVLVAQVAQAVEELDLMVLLPHREPLTLAVVAVGQVVMALLQAQVVPVS